MWNENKVEFIYVYAIMLIFVCFLLGLSKKNSFHSSLNYSKRYIKINNSFLAWLLISQWVTDVDRICTEDANKLSFIALIHYTIVAPLCIASLLIPFFGISLNVSANLLFWANGFTLLFHAIKWIDCIPAVKAYKQERTKKYKEQVLKELYDENEGE